MTAMSLDFNYVVDLGVNRKGGRDDHATGDQHVRDRHPEWKGRIAPVHETVCPTHGFQASNRAAGMSC